MTSVEIEDVLSSIRRLVSEDLRPAPRAMPLLAAEEPPPGAKLILTPALRVVAPQLDDESAASQEPAAEAAQTLPDMPHALAEPEQADRFDAPYRNFADIPLADEADPFAVNAAVVEVLGPPTSPRYGDFGFASAIEEAIDSGEGLQVLLDAPDLDDARWDDSRAAFGAPAASPEAGAGIEDVVSVVGAAIGAQRGEWDADGSDAAEVSAGTGSRDADTLLPPLQGLRLVENDRFRDVPADDDALQAWAAEAAWAHDDEPDQPEPATPARPAEPEVWDEDQQRLADLAEAAAVAEILSASAAVAPRPAFDDDLLVDEDGALDVEMLREMVRDIIREELQGPLGERITRNVRKLVRAEINRALSSRDFD